MRRHSPLYRNCCVCGRPFRIQINQLRVRPGVFCTTTCRWKSWRAFQRALQEGLLEQILSSAVVREWLAEDPRTARGYGERSHHRRLRGDRERERGASEVMLQDRRIKFAWSSLSKPYNRSRVS
jgi:hypothetical protein